MTGLKRMVKPVPWTLSALPGGLTRVLKVVVTEWPAALVTVTLCSRRVSEVTVGGRYWVTKVPAVAARVRAPLGG